MKLWSLKDESGSAILEFIVFVLVGQLLIFSGAMVAAQSLDQKVRLELFASQMARATALGKPEALQEVLTQDYNLEGVSVSAVPCPEQFVCLVASLGESRANGVSIVSG
ncbi:MAG: hypothetical protein RLZZ56_81 [Actinomycetota bacterium]|jgi:hypothetical protein